MKIYATTKGPYKTLVHIDAYRLESSSELAKLGWAEIINNPENIVVIEWPEKVSDLIPNTAHKVNLVHVDEEMREIY